MDNYQFDDGSREDPLYAGIYFSKGGEKEFWVFHCPCGVRTSLGVNEIPLVDTPFPCGNPHHWLIKIEKENG